MIRSMKKSENRRSGGEKILSTAVKLYYSRGINNVGIDEIIKCSGVTKGSLYYHFKSKDDLVVAFLEYFNAQWLPDMKEKVSRMAPTPEKYLITFFDALGQWFKSNTFRGCPNINTTAEISNTDHTAFKKALFFKQELLDYIEELVKQAGVVDSKEISLQVLLLIDGAIVRAAMTGKSESAIIAKRACAALIVLANNQHTNEGSNKWKH